MSDFTIFDIVPANLLSLNQGTYIVLHNANSIPPHLSILSSGFFYTLTIKGPKVDVPLEIQLKNISLKRIPTLFVKLKTEIFVKDNQVFVSARDHILSYSRVESGISTCLSPIKNFCSSLFNVDISDINFVYDLIYLLQKTNRIDQFSHIYMDNLLMSNSFRMKKYSMQDIYESIYRSELILS